MSELIIRQNVVAGIRKWQNHVDIPAGVTEIAPEAFRRVLMQTVTIPPGLRVVGEDAFRDCAFLQKVVLPSSLERIGARAFAGCESLQEVVLPGTVRELPGDVFLGCARLERVQVLPDSPDWGHQSNLLWKRDSSIVIWLPGSPGRTCEVPEGITAIPPYTFAGSSLAEITLPASVETIGESGIMDCSSLTALHLSAGLRSIGEFALAGCRELRNLVLPDTLEVLADLALQVSGVRELVLPASLRVLGTGVFRQTELQRLVVLGELPENTKVFSLSNLGVLYTDSFDLQADRIPMSKFSRATQEVVLRNFLRRWSAGEPIPEETRKNRLEFIRRKQKELRWDPGICDVLLEERLVGVREIDDFLEEALQRGDGEMAARLLEYQEKHLDRQEKARLEEQKLRKELRVLSRPGPTMGELKKMWPGRLLDDGSWMIRGYKDVAEKVEELTVPSSLLDLPVTRIGSYAFSPEAQGRRKVVQALMNSLRRVRISEGITVIEDHAFRRCQSLEWVQLPEGLEELPVQAFWDCCNLQAVELPSTLKRIRAGCFWYCEALKDVALPEGLEELGDNVFYGCTSLRSIRLPRSLRFIGRDAFRDCSSLEEVEVEPGGRLEALGKAAFRDCKGLKRIGALAGLTELPDDAFVGCGKLKEIVLPDSLVRIMDGAFPKRQSLCFVVSPESYGARWAMKHGREYRLKQPDPQNAGTGERKRTWQD